MIPSLDSDLFIEPADNHDIIYADFNSTFVIKFFIFKIKIFIHFFLNFSYIKLIICQKPNNVAIKNNKIYKIY